MIQRGWPPEAGFLETASAAGPGLCHNNRAKAARKSSKAPEFTKRMGLMVFRTQPYRRRPCGG
jgi:hypothetical protein